jgi:hypothetical protein
LGEFVHTLLLSEYFDGDWLGEFGKSWKDTDCKNKIYMFYWNL